jgi:alkylation response protein AidB-like acyl-CoA dehydrogenase
MLVWLASMQDLCTSLVRGIYVAIHGSRSLWRQSCLRLSFRNRAFQQLHVPASEGHACDLQREFQRIARDFAAKELLPHAADWDAQKQFPVDTLRAAAELGFASVYIAEDVGGAALSRADAAVIFEALAYGDISTTAYLTIHNMVSHCIDRCGRPPL